jgi:SAM-dependent methyltransferase
MTGVRHLAMTPTACFGRLMALTNDSAYRVALGALNPAPRRLLEIGFGAGRFIELALKRWPAIEITGIDPTPDMLGLAGGRAAIRGAGDRIALLQACAEQMPLPAQGFDAAVAIHSFQFWSPPGAALDELVRVLKPGGRVVLVLRRHGAEAPAWLPNPISRSGAEIDGAMALFTAHRFQDIQTRAVGRSHVLTAKSPARSDISNDRPQSVSCS